MKPRWHHTEFGRRTDCETYRIVREGLEWVLLDADWNPLADPVATIEAAQHQANQHAARAAARRSTGNVSATPVAATAQTVGES